MRNRRPHHPAGVGPHFLALLLASAPTALACAVPAQEDAAVTNIAAPSRADTLRAVHLLQRATYGPRPRDVAEVLRIGPTVWLDRQLQPDSIDDDALAERLDEVPSVHLSIAELYRAYPPRKRLRDSLGVGDSPGDSPSREARRELRRRNPRRILDQLTAAKLQRAVHSERQLQVVMTDFWFNHFNVFFNQGRARWLVADYERSAIRPHVFGTFEDLLVATASHPAMLFYLDNWRSRKPGSPNGRGLNENYARELLELHTLGVHGGYTQQDVIEVARAFTGWTITPPRGKRPARRRAGNVREAGEMREGGDMRETGAADSLIGRMRFIFRPAWHDDGEKVLLGDSLPAGRGREDGLDVLRTLANHPSTARHVATKLAQHFVADEPPAALIDELAAVFLDTGGDLRAVTRALFTSEAFHAPRHRVAKIKRPFDLVASALRVTGAEVENGAGVVRLLSRFRDRPYMERAPTGYPTSSASWVSSAAVLNRMNFAFALVSGEVTGISPVADRLRQRAARATSNVDLVATLAAHALPGRSTPELIDAVTQDLDTAVTSNRQALADRALGLILGSPDFQRR